MVATFFFVDLLTQCPDMPRQVIGRIFPNGRCLKHQSFFRERKGFAHQPPIHLTRSQVGALDIRGVSAGQIQRLLITIDDLNLDLDYATAFAMLDHLQVMPSRLRLFLFQRQAFAIWLSRGHLAPGFHHRFAVSAFSISRHRRRRLCVTAILELVHQFFGDFFFGLGDRPPDAESGVGFERRAAPERAALVFFSDPFFSPLWPT